ncbi:MAG: protein-glutamate O-methyltransferase CheR [Alphaproteobacteria bacterium]|nr:protein-glutamate O-methyltransferase CheR [Alphaproteobacteria bacterium]
MIPASSLPQRPSVLPTFRLVPSADPDYSRLKSLIIEATGMVFYRDRDAELCHVIEHRLAALTVDNCAAYLGILGTGTGAGRRELDILIGELTIGETYFFRHREQFDALEQRVLPELIVKNQAQRRLRIWSAGCATGPEPYTIAILLKRGFAALTAGWSIEILGTDINRKFLAQAREGWFQTWALRNVPDDIRTDCFDSEGGKTWRLKPQYREMVRFLHHNLVDDKVPIPGGASGFFDLIVCRNVTIYFDADRARHVVAGLYDALSDKGWLIAGHSEASAALFRNFTTVNVPGAVLYRKEGLTTLEVAKTSSAPWRPHPHGPEIPPPARASRTPPPIAPEPPTTPGLAEVRTLVDQGKWRQAASLCETLRKKNALDPSLHLYYALALESLDRAPEALQALQRAIYLDRSDPLVHYHLGLFLQRQGERSSALKSFRNACKVLARLDEGAVLDHGDGMTAHELAALARLQIEGDNG